MLFQRQKILLYLARLAGGRIDKLRLMKLCFLAREEGHVVAPAAIYGFVPYQYGPFSFTLYRDLDKLTHEGYLSETKSKVALASTSALPALDPIARFGAAAVWEKYGTWNLEKLVGHVYEKYPWYTVNAKANEKRAGTRPTTATEVYTAGYEGLAFDDFLNRLLRCGIQRVVDVRANPVARRYGFHRSTLNRTLDKLNIAYVHEPLLGIPGEERAEVGFTTNYDQLFAWYADEVLPRETAAVSRVVKMMGEKPSVLICMEADPAQCHRSRLGAFIARETSMQMRDLRDVVPA